MRREEIIELLFETPFEALCERAARVLEEEKGSHVHVRGLIEFSNVCRRNCRYCGLRAENANLRRYTLDKTDIMAAAKNAVTMGADTIVLQSGESAIEPMWLADVVDCLRGDLNVPVTLSVGEHSRAAYSLWKEAGAVRFLLKHETADPKLYTALHPGHELAERISCLRVLQRLGYEIGSGFMVGLPGQRPETLADDIILSRRLGVSMCGAGPFIPQHDTPLGAYPSGSAQLALRVMAVMRIAMPWANIPATTALATVDALGGQRNGLLVGGNVLMPSFTPPAYGKQYRIYDNKNRVDMHAEHLEAVHGVGPHTISVPRIRRADDINPDVFDNGISDDTFARICACIRVSVPYTGMIVSTRESKAVREKVLPLGISQISGGSRTSVGGYYELEPEEDNSAQFDVSDRRTLDEVVRWLMEQGHVPSFCTACYREGRTGDRFMSLCKSQQILNCCHPNALLTLKEYLQDYASPQTRQMGLAMIAQELNKIPSDKVRKKAVEYLAAIENGQPDFRF